MDSLREKLKAYTDLQCPITGPGVRRLEELLIAIVERIEPEESSRPPRKQRGWRSSKRKTP